MLSHNFPCVQSESVAQPHHPEGSQTGRFSGVHSDGLAEEHWVHWPANGPDVLQAGNKGFEHMKGAGLLSE